MGTVLLIGAVVVFLVVMPIAGSLSSERAARRLSLRRAVEQRETKPIAALRDGELAKIRGVVRAREALLTSPISERACVGYRVLIDDVTHDPDQLVNGLVRREAWSSFLVEDETGSVAVQGSLDVAIDPSAFASETPLPPGVHALLAEEKVRTWDLFRPRRFWYREWLLKPGDRVSVVGRPRLQVDPAGRASFREEPRLHVMAGTPGEPVAVTDDDG
jgi:hypothetical protein